MKKTLNGHEKKAARAIKEEFNWIVGGWYNSMQDGYEDEIPTLQEAKDSVYEEAMSNHEKEIRFAGEEFCRAYIEKLFAKDAYVAEIKWAEEEPETKEEKEVEEMKKVTREEARAQVAKWSVKEMREHLKDAGIKGFSRAKKEELIEMILDLEEKNNTSKNTVEISKVKMFAFTGMYIGEFEAEVQDGKILVNTVSKGELMFDLNTGKELTEPNKSRYANRVERA